MIKQRHFTLGLAFLVGASACLSVPNRPPQVQMITPSATAYTFTDEIFSLKASAIDPDGVTRVEFLADGKIVGIAYKVPYIFELKNPPVGTHQIAARAYDTKGLSATSLPTTLIVRGALDVALDQVLQPAAALSATTINPVLILKNWGKTAISSATVTYSLDNGSAFSFSWSGSLDAEGGQATVTLPPLRNENGGHSMTFSVKNPNGSSDNDPSNDSQTRSFTSKIVNNPPSVKMTSPGFRSAVFQADTFAFEATVSDKDGTISRVQYFADNILLGESADEPFSLRQRVDLTVGTYNLTAKAFDDRDSASVSLPTILTVNAPLDLGIPQILGPTGTTTTVGLLPSVLVRNYGNRDVTTFSVKYQLDNAAVNTYNWLGKLAAATQTTVILPTLRNENGPHILKIWLEKPNGLTDGNPSNDALSTIFSSAVINAPPSVNLTAPTGSITILSNQAYIFKAWATDRDGTISKIEFLMDSTTLLGVDSVAPYELTRQNLPVGTHKITARATDDRSATTTSVATTLIVNLAPHLVGDETGDSSENWAIDLLSTLPEHNGIGSAKSDEKKPPDSISAETPPSVSTAETNNFSVFFEEKTNELPSASLQLSPNPATYFVNLKLYTEQEGVYDLSFVGTSGIVLQQKKVDLVRGENALYWVLNADLPSNVYVIRVQKGQVVVYRKLLVMR